MKWVNPAAYNAQLAYITANADELYLCTADIVDTNGDPQYSLIVGSAKILGPISLVPGDFTVTDGVSGGRTLEIAGQTELVATAAGRPSNLCLLDSGDLSDTGIVLITSFSYGDVAIGDKVSFEAFNYELPTPY
jgi:hypothetical protein